ncbi:hypothetical protein [Hyphococcus sp.]|uniref:hypothetical protein n=1 Tax=Hyphococcus sp. TaxID=2038636 RepID=UPI003CCC14F6
MSDSKNAQSLTGNQRSRIAEIADILMPPGDTLPAPSEVDISGIWIDSALNAAPGMRGVLDSVLEMQGSADAIVKELRDRSPEMFMAFSFFLAGAYFMHPQVRNALGYEGQAIEENPVLEGEAEFFLEDGLLEPVKSRGPIYREI